MTTVINNISTTPKKIENPKLKTNSKVCYRGDISYEEQPEASKKVKAGVLLTTVAGVATAMLGIYKFDKYLPKLADKLKDSNNIVAKYIKSKSEDSVKDAKNYFQFLFKKHNYDPLDIMTIASSSLIGGLTGGMIFDKKENRKAKIREGIIQILGNIMTPLTFVASGTSLFNHFYKKAKGAPPPMAAGILVTLATLGVAIEAGNKVSNAINEKFFNIKDNRKIKISDFSGHIDDGCLAFNLGLGSDNVVGKVASKVIPYALMVCGYSAGTMQEWPDDVKDSKKVDPNRAFGA